MQHNKIIKKYCKPDEELYLVIREHGIIQLPVFAIGFISYFLSLFLAAWLSGFGLVGLIIFVVWFCVSALYLARRFLIWQGDMVIITSARLIDVHRFGIVSQRVAEVPWSAIKEIHYEQRGLWSAVWQYGTIVLAIDGWAQPLQIQHVYHPQEVRDILAEHAKVNSPSLQ